MRFLTLSLLFLLLAPFSFAQRVFQTINSGWQFSSDNTPSETELVNLPHTWNAKDAFVGNGKYYRGTGHYSKTIRIPEAWAGKQLYLKFEGANQLTNLWVNDQFVGSHTGGYTAFVFNITKYLSFGKENNLRIDCDNSYNPNVPPLSADFTFYGGIYRDVYLIATNPLQIEIDNLATGNLQITTPQVSEKQASIVAQLNLINHSEETKKARVQLKVTDPSGKEVYTSTQKIKLEKGQKIPVQINFNIENPKLWSPENPQLYSASISLLNEKTNKPIDQVSSNFGCRWFYADAEKGFFLNGKHYRLMGTSRHQDLAGLGNALPNVVHEKDLKQIKAMGSNFIRICHYPHDPDVYDWCDKLGLIVWSEIPIVNQITNSEVFVNNCLHMQSEHIQQNISHPSVVMWGYMNEVFLRPPFKKETTEVEKQKYIEAAVTLAQQLNDETNQLDSTRLTVMALHASQLYNTSGIADIPDVIGWNLYMGWYGGKLDQLGDFLDREHQNHPTRPILISEYGPGADVRIQTDSPKPWDFSEAYQLVSHKSYIDQVMNRDFVLGMAAWNFADFGSAGRVDAIPNVNQKGLLTFDRDTKDIYHYYQARLLSKPFVYIAGKHHGTYFIDENDTVKIPVFSNCDTVQLLVDRHEKTALAIQEGMATAQLILGEGQHHLQLIGNRESFCRNIEVKFRSHLLNTIQTSPIAINVGSHCDFTDNITHETWIADQAYSEGNWGFIGGTVYQKSKNRFQGTDQNIRGTTNDPLFQTMREGIEAYQFDVAPGSYRITLLMAEPTSENRQRVVYDLGTDQTKANSGARVFTVKVNDLPVIYDLNLTDDYGANQAVTASTSVQTENGITVQFEAKAGKPILSGIKIESISFN